MLGVVLIMYININEQKKEAQIELGYRLLKLKTAPENGTFKLCVGSLSIQDEGQCIKLYPENLKALRDCLSKIIDENGL